MMFGESMRRGICLTIAHAVHMCVLLLPTFALAGFEGDGIYEWLHHPSEIGLLLIATGAPLLIGAPFTAIAAIILLLPISRWRMQREDVALSA